MHKLASVAVSKVEGQSPAADTLLRLSISLGLGSIVAVCRLGEKTPASASSRVVEVRSELA